MGREYNFKRSEVGQFLPPLKKVGFLAQSFMSQDIRKKALEEFIQRIKTNYSSKVEKIIVFGSYARGEAGEESDIDVLVVGDIGLKELIDEAVPILLKYGVLVSPHDITLERFKFLKSEGTSFIRNVEREGVVYA